MQKSLSLSLSALGPAGSPFHPHARPPVLVNSPVTAEYEGVNRVGGGLGGVYYSLSLASLFRFRRDIFLSFQTLFSALIKRELFVTLYHIFSFFPLLIEIIVLINHIINERDCLVFLLKDDYLLCEVISFPYSIPCTDAALSTMITFSLRF